MVYLLGISHKFQIRTFISVLEGGLMDYDPALARRFEEYLENQVVNIVPYAIGEEESDSKLQDVCQMDDRAYSVAKNVCAKHNVKHVMCDPDRSERDLLYAARGVTEDDDVRNGWPIREGEWLKRIRPMLPHGGIIFICGADHVNTFRGKLEQNGETVKILCPDLEQYWEAK